MHIKALVHNCSELLKISLSIKRQLTAVPFWFISLLWLPPNAVAWPNPFELDGFVVRTIQSCRFIIIVYNFHLPCLSEDIQNICWFQYSSNSYLSQQACQFTHFHRHQHAMEQNLSSFLSALDRFPTFASIPSFSLTTFTDLLGMHLFFF